MPVYAYCSDIWISYYDKIFCIKFIVITSTFFLVMGDLLISHKIMVHYFLDLVPNIIIFMKRVKLASWGHFVFGNYICINPVEQLPMWDVIVFKGHGQSLVISFASRMSVAEFLSTISCGLWCFF